MADLIMADLILLCKRIIWKMQVLAAVEGLNIEDLLTDEISILNAIETNYRNGEFEK